MQPDRRRRTIAFSVSSTFLVGMLCLTACASGAVRWQPSFASQVPDSTPVRFVVARNEPAIQGRAADWQLGRPKLITERGDTVENPTSATLEVRLKNRVGHPVAGAIAAWAVGVGISYATCPPPKKYCGEEDPTPLLAAGLGALIGSRIKTDKWVEVRWGEP